MGSGIGKRKGKKRDSEVYEKKCSCGLEPVAWPEFVCTRCKKMIVLPREIECLCQLQRWVPYVADERIMLEIRRIVFGACRRTPRCHFGKLVIRQLDEAFPAMA
mmetsp:Transcript_21265/g.42218  ORF Transcript_21265/g.42218 Transcript_21265/m.42218 type:complete len:104 (-) Transcript_21265:530-841(-)